MGLKGLFRYASFFLFAVGHGRLRRHWVVNVRLYYRIRLKTAVLRHGYHHKRLEYFAVYDTASYDRNTVPTKRAVYGRIYIVYDRLLRRKRLYSVVYDRRIDRPGSFRTSLTIVHFCDVQDN